MNIKEVLEQAIRSGNKFGRISDIQNNGFFNFLIGKSSADRPILKLQDFQAKPYSFNTEELLADDWIIEQEQISITPDICHKAFDSIFWGTSEPDGYLKKKLRFMKELGFKIHI